MLRRVTVEAVAVDEEAARRVLLTSCCRARRQAEQIIVRGSGARRVRGLNWQTVVGKLFVSRCGEVTFQLLLMTIPMAGGQQTAFRECAESAYVVGGSVLQPGQSQPSKYNHKLDAESRGP